ncbi:hypothetical protein P7K49_020888 [Saguinus oedipus]|uniref:Uncharacterized protein n=1 Tax=Saguinus oedipus TaxID=9490 RepID=A0ABQ9URY6_SAGOE|nr:hypothetical protein P7K49_020888 [Saguinus oedipus]
MTTLNDCPETQESGEKRKARLEETGEMEASPLRASAVTVLKHPGVGAASPSLPASPRALGLEEKRRAQLDASFSLAWNHQTKEVYWVWVEKKEAEDAGYRYISPRPEVYKRLYPQLGEFPPGGSGPRGRFSRGSRGQARLLSSCPPVGRSGPAFGVVRNERCREPGVLAVVSGPSADLSPSC